MRCDNNSKLQDSAPCQNCLTTILELNIKRIVFSYKDNTFISCDPKELTINHISAGNNFIKRLETNTNNTKNTNNTNNTKNTNKNKTTKQIKTKKQITQKTQITQKNTNKNKTINRQ